MSLLGERTYYKPFDYPWAYNFFKIQNSAHWIAEEVPMENDIKDFHTKLTKEEKNIVTQVLKFFTQGDLDVANNYMDRLLNVFKLPELRMMLSTFNAFEAIHVNAYAYLSDSLNLDGDKNFYKSFLDIKEMKEKHDYMAALPMNSTRDLAKVIAIFGGFVEGVQLFSSFAILNSFPRRNLLKNTAQIITWSIRDESLHCAAMTQLFRDLIKENQEIWTDDFKKEIYEACKHIVQLEEQFIDACFEMGDIEGLKAKDLKKYIHYLADVRLGDLGLKPIYRVKKHNLQWLDNLINAPEHANFFESRATNYSKATIIDDMKE